MRISAGISLLGLMGISVGCGTSSLAPSPLTGMTTTVAFPDAAFSVTAISPPGGLTGESVRVAGTGFLPGARLTLDGIAASVTTVTSTVITAIIPTHTAGIVDVVVTNPGGQSGTLTRSYTYGVVTLTPSANRVMPGAPLTVTWAAPDGRSNSDWIGFFKVRDPSTSYLSGWWEYTNGARSGTFTFSAPAQPGDYEFRYLVDDGFIDAARSSPVTIVVK